ncbi:MAG: hypothetical protein D3910_07285 [Candidatus Electrothrix sp. ATG2]|nr:hypothetical protein [Candidatus Electrothrix sp. ATG2]
MVQRASISYCVSVGLLFFMISLTISPAFAEPIYILIDGQLTGIQGVEVNGIVYDVEFKGGSFLTTFGDESGLDFITAESAFSAATALSEVMIDGTEGQFDSDNNLTYGCSITDNCHINIPYLVLNDWEEGRGLDWVRVAYFKNHDRESDDFIYAGANTYQDLNMSPQWSGTWADFTIVNQSPVAVAGDSFVAYLGDMVTLNGTASYDIDNNVPLAFTWEIISAPVGGVVTMNNPDTFFPSFVPELPGDYIINLTVTDSLGLVSAPSSVTVVVLSEKDVVIDSLQNFIAILTALDDSSFSKKNKARQVSQLIDIALKNIEEKNYIEALNKVKQVLIRVDGCALRGAPDTITPKNEIDWVVMCDAQAGLYPLAKEAYDLLVAF